MKQADFTHRIHTGKPSWSSAKIAHQKYIESVKVQATKAAMIEITTSFGLVIITCIINCL